MYMKNIAKGLGVAALAFGLSAPAQAQETQNYIMATASTGGTYYPVGVAIATLVKVKLEASDNIGMSAISSAGSGENVRLMREDEVQFSILQGLFGYYAWEGEGPVEADGPQTGLRSIAALWPNVEHFVVSSDVAPTGTIEDFVALKGQAVALGARNSGTIGSNDAILGNLGAPANEETFELFYAGYGPSAQALQDGRVKGISTPAGVPVSALTSLMAQAGDNVRLLGFTDEQVVQANGKFGELWVPYNIPAGTYPGQTYDVVTIAQPNFLAVNADIPEETVYLITKTIFENLPFLNAIHAATREMSLETALGGLPMPLHPGALRYYEEAGLTSADRLRPPAQ